MLYMLDTNVVSDIVKRRSPVARLRLYSLGRGETICVSAITDAGIRYGLAKKREALRLRSLMEEFLGNTRVMAWGREEARIYGNLKAKLESFGKSLGAMDMMIAAHAVATGAVLVTNDKAFGQVEDLRGLVNWATDL